MEEKRSAGHLEQQLLQAKSHKEVRDLCQRYGGKYIYNEPGSGEMTYRFANSIFISDCLVNWSEFDFLGAHISAMA